MYAIVVGDGELVWVRVLEVSIYDSLDEYHVGVLCILPWVRDVLLVCDCQFFFSYHLWSPPNKYVFFTGSQLYK